MAFEAKAGGFKNQLRRVQLDVEQKWKIIKHVATLVSIAPILLLMGGGGGGKTVYTDHSVVDSTEGVIDKPQTEAHAVLPSDSNVYAKTHLDTGIYPSLAPGQLVDGSQAT